MANNIDRSSLFPPGFSMSLKSGERNRVPRGVIKWRRNEALRTRGDVEALSRQRVADPISKTSVVQKNPATTPEGRVVDSVSQAVPIRASGELVIDEVSGRRGPVALMGELENRGWFNCLVRISMPDREPCETILQHRNISGREDDLDPFIVIALTGSPTAADQFFTPTEGKPITIKAIDSVSERVAAGPSRRLVIDQNLASQGIKAVNARLREHNLLDRPIELSQNGEKWISLNSLPLDWVVGADDKPTNIYVPSSANPAEHYTRPLISDEGNITIRAVGSESSEEATVTEFLIDNDLGRQGRKALIQRLRELDLFGKRVITRQKQPESTDPMPGFPFVLEEAHIQGSQSDISIEAGPHALPFKYLSPGNNIVIKVLPKTN